METDIFYDINKLFDKTRIGLEKIGKVTETNVKSYVDRLEMLKQAFSLKSVAFMFESDFGSYRDSVQSENFMMDLTIIITDAIRCIGEPADPIGSSIYISEVEKLRSIVETEPIPDAPDLIASKCEECGGTMDVYEETSEYRCGRCGLVVNILGAVFRDEQIYTQDGIRTRSANNITYRHYRAWMDQIQGNEIFEPDAESLAKIKAVIARDGIFKGDLNSEIMRRILKDPTVERTNWNEHTTHLIHDVGGRRAPSLTYEEDKLISIKFAKAIQLYGQAASETAQYKSYYPDLIRRIIEVDFANNPEKLRLVKYIHLQHRKTTIKNDLVYKKICELADPKDGLVYKPTDPDRSYYNSL